MSGLTPGVQLDPALSIKPFNLVDGRGVDPDVVRDRIRAWVACDPSTSALDLWNPPTKLILTAMDVFDTSARKQLPVGRLILGHHEADAGHARISLVMDSTYPRDARDRVLLLGINFAFATWNLRKLYLFSSRLDEPLSARHQVPAGTLKDYLVDGTTLLDVTVHEISRSAWDLHRTNWLAEPSSMARD